MRLNFEASEAQYEPHEDTGEPPIPLTQPCSVTVDLPGNWIQITYSYLRSYPYGDNIAYMNFETGFWHMEVDLPVRDAMMIDGTRVDPETVSTQDMVFTDIVIS